MLSSVVFALFASQAAAVCNANGWCSASKLNAYYACTDLESCITSKLSMDVVGGTMPVTLKYNLPAFKDGENDAKEFDTPDFADILKTTAADDKGAFFQLATGLKTGGNLVGYLMVAQGIAFKPMQLTELSVPEIDGMKLKPCAYKMTGDKCDPKNLKESEFKFSFGVYQKENCATPDSCFFILRASMDTSETGTAAVSFNGNATLNLANPPAATVAIATMAIGKFAVEFPTGVNVNNENYDEKGCDVYVESVEGKVINLAFKVKAPGAGKFLIYDPLVDNTGTASPTASASPTATAETSASIRLSASGAGVLLAGIVGLIMTAY